MAQARNDACSAEEQDFHGGLTQDRTVTLTLLCHNQGHEGWAILMHFPSDVTLR